MTVADEGDIVLRKYDPVYFFSCVPDGTKLTSRFPQNQEKETAMHDATLYFLFVLVLTIGTLFFLHSNIV